MWKTQTFAKASDVVAFVNTNGVSVQFLVYDAASGQYVIFYTV